MERHIECLHKCKPGKHLPVWPAPAFLGSSTVVLGYNHDPPRFGDGPHKSQFFFFFFRAAEISLLES